MVRALDELYHFILTTSLGRRDYDYSHFIGEKTKVLTGRGTCTGSHGRYVVELGFGPRPDPKVELVFPHNASSETTNSIGPSLSVQIVRILQTNALNLPRETSTHNTNLTLLPLNCLLLTAMVNHSCLCCVMRCTTWKTCFALWRLLHIYRERGHYGLQMSTLRQAPCWRL